MRWKMLAAALGLLGALLLSACGATTTNQLGGGGAAPASTTPASSALLSTRNATVKGASETVLTNAQGMTLYYFDHDTTTKVACVSGCVATWPPLLASNGAAPTSAASLPGGLSILNGANGQQVLYNGHPLYTFSGDKQPGDTKGDGILGLWHVATPSLMPASAPAANPTPTSGGSGGGYGSGNGY
ncbi:MAG: COG4315 family predicted lipoprotein [Ktedonobacterales bacterium]